MSLEAGTRVGRYEIRRPLGKGGMGEVYLAHDPDLDRPVALKILPQEVAFDAERMRRFVQEAKAASALNHPSILTIHEIGAADSLRFIATEFVEGVTLRERLAGLPIPLEETLDVALQAASALTAAHAAGVVHRDIKPENIMLRRDGLLKLLDFGLAKLVPALAPAADATTRSGLLTEAGVVMGTARYMSPEQACGLPVDARTDVWSLGVVLYEMAAGRSPWEGATTGEVLSELLQRGAPPPLAHFAPAAPAELGRIVSRALAKNREERYASMSDLALDLKRLQQGLPAAPPKPPRAGDTAAPRSHRVRAPAALAIGGLAAAALAGALYFGLAKKSPIRSLAVLPLASPPGDAEAELLSDGITETLISSLSQVPDLKVIARSSAFRYKGRDADPRRAGRELGVEAVVTGHLSRRGDRLAVGVEMMQVGDQRQLWGEQYDRPVADLLTVQREMSREISEQLRRRLTPEARARVARIPTENVEAYRLYMQGRYYWYKFPRPEFQKSREYFQQAIDLDPSYALAYAGLADFYGFSAAMGSLPAAEAWAKSEAAAQAALRLDENLAEVHNPLGAQRVLIYGDWSGAERHFKRAIELNPSFAEVYSLYAIHLMAQGRIEESLAMQRKGQELDPLSGVFHRRLASILYLARRVDEAIAEYHKALELDAGDPWAHEQLGDAYELAGRPGDAIQEWSAALTLGGNGELAALLERTFAESGFDTAVKALARARLEQLRSRAEQGQYVPAMDFVRLHMQLGEREPALEWLAKAERERVGELLAIGLDPLYDPVRADPRFVDLLRRLGLPPAPPTSARVRQR